MPWLEVECPNEECPGREESHPYSCACKGSGRAPREDGPGYEDCDGDPDIVPERWLAFWRNSTLTQPGEWAASIHCPKCGEEGEEVED
jgi:hypothetical protein